VASWSERSGCESPPEGRGLRMTLPSVKPDNSDNGAPRFCCNLVRNQIARGRPSIVRRTSGICGPRRSSLTVRISAADAGASCSLITSGWAPANCWATLQLAAGSRNSSWLATQPIWVPVGNRPSTGGFVPPAPPFCGWGRATLPVPTCARSLASAARKELESVAPDHSLPATGLAQPPVRRTPSHPFVLSSTVATG